MNAPKTNPEVKLPTATHTAEGPYWMSPNVPQTAVPSEPPQGFVGFQEAAGKGALATALAKAQGEMKAAAFNRVNPHFKSKYADLASLIDAIRGALAKHGIAHTEAIEMEPFRLVTTLHHGSETISSSYPLPVDATHHELGGAITYGRRYTLSGLTGIASEEDDDANAAVAAQAKITPEQIEHLDILLKDMPDGTHDRLLAYMSKVTKTHIEALKDIPLAQFPTAFAALEKKRTEKPAKEPKP